MSREVDPEPEYTAYCELANKVSCALDTLAPSDGALRQGDDDAALAKCAGLTFDRAPDIWSMLDHGDVHGWGLEERSEYRYLVRV